VAARNEGQKVRKDILNKLAAKDSIRAITDLRPRSEQLTKAMNKATCAVGDVVLTRGSILDGI
jgi:hypothetical protein